MPTDVSSATELVARLGALREEVAALEFERFASESCAVLVEALAALEKSCGAAAVRAARHASAGGEHRVRGFADAHDWVATATGTTSSAAREALRTITEVEQCPEVRDALALGDVSLAQASEIVRTAAEVPGFDAELLDVARTGTLGAVRTRARKRRVESIDPEELGARQHAAREFTHHRDELGMVCGRFRLHPLVGAPLVNLIERETDPTLACITT
jgi:hypothetical protein